MNLRDVIKSEAEVTAVTQRIIRSPIFLATYLGLFVFTYFFSAGYIFGEAHSLRRFASYFGLGVIELLIAYVFFGRAFHFGLVRNIPLLASSICFWFVLILTQQSFSFTFLYGPDITMADALAVQLATGILIVITSIGMLAIFANEISQRVSWLPEYTPIWQPLKTMPDLLLRHLDPENRGVVLRLQADGKTLNVVTDKGAQSLRMPLKDALELIAPDVGLKVHRSLWIRADQIEDLFHENGNPKIVDRDGNTFAISRSMISAVQDALQKG